MGQRDHSKKVVEMVKKHEEKYAQGVKTWLNVIFLDVLALLKRAKNWKNVGAWDILLYYLQIV
jgi:hypothetical protein